MHSRLHHRPTARWPFWLLLAAWICANSPQPAVFAFLAWLDDARHFTHQQRLTADVAFLLVGEKPPPVAAHTPVNLPKQPTPAVPAEAVAKKIELGLESTPELPAPALFILGPRLVAAAACDSLRAPPLLGPPRRVWSA